MEGGGEEEGVDPEKGASFGMVVLEEEGEEVERSPCFTEHGAELGSLQR